MTRLSIDRIEATADAIDPVFKNSPQYLCPGLSAALGCRVVLKVETLNPVRCFKGRGTETILSRLDSIDGPKLVVCVSAGRRTHPLLAGRMLALEISAVSIKLELTFPSTNICSTNLYTPTSLI